MANLKVSEQAYPSTRYTEAAAPSTPASGEVILYAKTDGLLYSKDDVGAETALGGGSGDVATDAIWDAKGDLAAGTGANTAAKLTVGANDTVLMADSGQSNGLKWVASQTPSTQAFGDAAAEGTADTYARGDHKHAMPADPGGYALPKLSNQASNYSASTTSLVVTMTAPTVDSNLICLVYSTGRGANSITQTNVTWTQRYTGNGNSQYFEVWTGVVASSPGTTATVALTGANKVFAETFQVDGVSSWTTAAALTSGTTTAGSGTANAHQATAGAAGDYVIAAVSANSPASAYQGINVEANVTGSSAVGGAGRFMMVRAPTNLVLHYWSVQASSVGWFLAFVKVS